MIYDSREGTGEFSTKANYKVIRDEELCTERTGCVYRGSELLIRGFYTEHEVTQ